MKQANKKLESHVEKPSKQTTNVITCLMSASVTLLAVDCFLVYVINKLDHQMLKNIKPLMPYLRISLAFAYGFFAAGVCVKTFVKHHINYIHIFEIDYHYRLPARSFF